jgi:hypothetical protein
MAVYDKDSSAPAVIVCNYGYFNSNEFQFTRLIRIKVLNKNGYYLANQAFKFDANTSIRGVTYNLENGEIVKTKLRNESIFKEKLYQNIIIAKIAMPNVKVGSVLDIEYSFPGLPNTWEFQQEVPVMHSELIIEPSSYLRFRKNYLGYERLSISTDSRWVAQEMPAFKPEPYMNSSDNYITKFEIDLLDVNFPGYYESVSTSWDIVGKHLMEDENFGKTLGLGLYLNSLTNELESTGKKGEDLVKLAVGAVKKVRWNELNRLYTSNTALALVFRDEIGNSADINMILIQLLRKLNFEAHPVVLSTRENGLISTYSPNQNKLNYVLAHVMVDNKSMILDASEKYLPYNLLPMRCLNGNGIRVMDGKIEWVEIKSSRKDRMACIADIKLNDDLSLEGVVTNSYADYAAFNFRKKYTAFNSQQEYIDDLLKSKPGIQLKTYNLTGFDSLLLPVKEEFQLVAENQLQEIGDEIYLFPLLFEQEKENPFKTENRKYPVDFGVLQERNIIMKYSIPEGFTVVKLPSSQVKKTADNGINFVYSATLMNNTIQITYRLMVNKIMFLPDEYPNLREIYNLIIKAQAEPVILKRN